MLPEIFVHDSERVARFEREAKVLASLNHAQRQSPKRWLLSSYSNSEQEQTWRHHYNKRIGGIMIREEAKMGRPPVIEADKAFRIVLDVSSVGLTDDQYFRLCSDNRDLRIEMTAQKELIIMTPTNMETGRKNAKITMRLGIWAEQDATGECFDSSSEFTLPNGAKRSPDVCWILKSRWDRLTKEEKEKLTEVCPDFVLELRSPSDHPAELEQKMEEYIANGARLGWLLDPIDNRAVIYRPGQPPERIDKPGFLSGDPVLPGFKFDFTEIV